MGFGNDDRQSFRATIVDDCEGTLVVGDARVHVRMLDQSATGFKLATNDQRPIPEMTDAMLDMNDGVHHFVQIRHVAQEGGFQILGIKRNETRLNSSSTANGDVKHRRKTTATALILLAFMIVSALALQAKSVQNRLSAIPLFHASAHRERVSESGAVPSKRSRVPNLDRNRPFNFQICLEDETADWLELATAQRGMMRSLLAICGGARNNRLAPAQLAIVDFAAQASMLELLNTDQRSRLESELHRPLNASALLQTIIEQYARHMSPKELADQFGPLLVVYPSIATRSGVSQEVVAAVCKQLDDAFPPSDKHIPIAPNGWDANQALLEVSLRIERLKASCDKWSAP